MPVEVGTEVRGACSRAALADSQITLTHKKGREWTKGCGQDLASCSWRWTLRKMADPSIRFVMAVVLTDIRGGRRLALRPRF